jgi:hypothetical protein
MGEAGGAAGFGPFYAAWSTAARLPAISGSSPRVYEMGPDVSPEEASMRPVAPGTCAAPARQSLTGEPTARVSGRPTRRAHGEVAGERPQHHRLVLIDSPVKTPRHGDVGRTAATPAIVVGRVVIKASKASPYRFAGGGERPRTRPTPPGVPRSQPKIGITDRGLLRRCPSWRAASMPSARRLAEQMARAPAAAQ